MRLSGGVAANWRSPHISEKWKEIVHQICPAPPQLGQIAAVIFCVPDE
jgi:hypothetical protein